MQKTDRRPVLHTGSPNAKNLRLKIQIRPELAHQPYTVDNVGIPAHPDVSSNNGKQRVEGTSDVRVLLKTKHPVLHDVCSVTERRELIFPKYLIHGGHVGDHWQTLNHMVAQMTIELFSSATEKIFISPQESYMYYSTTPAYSRMQYILSIVAALFFSNSFVTGVPIQTGSIQSDAAQTCADPSLAGLYASFYSPTRIAHVVRLATDMIAFDTSVGTTDNYELQNPLFFAWPTAQEFTVPVHQLESTDGQDFMFVPEVNGTVPNIAGWRTQGSTVHAYATQVCGSVPLFTAFNAAGSDHWWTTNEDDHARMIANSGWVDAGIPFYVLPLDYDS
ncbi:hypothetical protein JR316_0008824 [Psilocybe cubensis]|uniref:Uncharacterized protein n=1 Tax=Psilocybe cubensis TaxID=181762 RepID=A0ACB8GTQ4_PSICU|nr:hypothetical protein JR316_0008824 [Psilocybe cubensis]KAH9478370.1 hypothetical protein JR316_0008824 [Psilocybe cubensis]